MSLRKKALVIISLAMTVLCLLLALILGGLTLRGYASLEVEDTGRQVGRAAKGLAEDIARIASIAGDWAPWDESYYFVRGENPAFVADNSSPSSFTNLGLNLMAFVDLSGRTLWARSFDLVEKKVVPPPADFVSFPRGSALLAHADIRSGASGLMKLSGGRLMLVASRPVTTSDFAAASIASLVMGRVLDAQEAGRLSERTSLELAFERLDSPSLAPDFLAARSSLAGGKMVFVLPLDGRVVAGYSLLTDIEGKPVAILRASLPRNIHRQGLSSLGFILLALALAAIFASALVFLMIDRLVLARVSRMGADIRRIGSSRDLGARVGAEGDDELAALASTINATFAELETVDRSLKTSLREKELLLREVHHRVKNNLQVVSSLLSLQSGVTPPGEAREALMESQNRIQSMALIHEILYQRTGEEVPDLSRVAFLGYLNQLSAYLADAYRVDPALVAIVVAGDEVHLDADTAITCGLIVSELVSNAFKHAFPGGRKGRLLIKTVRGEDGEIAFKVSDDGVGFPPGLDLGRTSSMGWQLISMLASQLKGRLVVASEGGASVSFFLPGPRPIRRGY